MPHDPNHLYSGGTALPVVPAHGGGFKTLEGDDYLLQLIRTHASDCDSDNPFQDEGIGLRAVFQNASASGWRSVIRQRVRAMFKDFQTANLAKLRSVTFPPGETEGEAIMNIKFLSIETNTELEAVTTFRR